MEKIERKEKMIDFLPVIFTLAVIGCMVAASELLDEREIIFPEVAAIAVGALLAPYFTWKTDKKRILFFIMLCAFLGMGIVYVCPGPLWAQLIAAYALSQLILAFSGTSFAPMVSALVLPVMLQTRTFLYLVSAFVFTSGILLLRTVLEKIRVHDVTIRAQDPYAALPFPHTRAEWWQIVKKILIAGVIITAAVGLGYRFVAAPPILVAFTEFANPKAPVRKHPFKAVILVSICAAVGAVSRLVFTITLGFPLTFSALIAGAVTIVFIYSFHMYFPPAGAMSLLAMLVPISAVRLYPVCAFIGVSIFMLFARMCFRGKS